MTKRVLSLLLTLVMVLSLCVPALAADEFEAEAPAEVVEEAPAAPVEPEAPEAEEVAEEPVAEEPVEEPEVAAAIAVEEEEEDLPLLVKLGIVTKEAHWNLYQAVEDAEDLLPGVQAGTLRAASFDLGGRTLSSILEKYISDPVANDPFVNATGDKAAKKDFENVLKTAQEYLTGIDGTTTTLTVNTANVQAIADELNAFLPGGANELVDDIYNADGTSKTNLTVAGLGKLITDHWNESYATKHGMDTALSSTLDVASGTKTAETWQKAYQPEYLAALQDAIDAYYELDGQYDVSYADYVAAVKLALTALTQEKKASKPDDDDLANVTAALGRVPSEVVYKSNNYVLDIDWAELTGSDGTSGKQNFKYALEDLLADKTNMTKKFKSTTTLWDVNDAIEHLDNALVPVGAPTIKFVDGSVTQTNDTRFVNVDFSVTNFDDSKATKTGVNEKVDGHTYGIAWHVDRADGTSNNWFAKDDGDGGEYVEGVVPTDANVIQKLVGSDGLVTAGWTTGSDATKWYAENCKITNTGVTGKTNDGDAFKQDDVVCIHVYEQNANGAWVEIKDARVDFKINNPGTATKTVSWPTLTAAKYNKGDTLSVGQFKATTNSLIKGAKGTLYGIGQLGGSYAAAATITLTVSGTAIDTTAMHDNYKVWWEIFNSNGDTIYKGSELTNVAIGTSTITLDTNDHDALLKAGTYTVALRSQDKTTKEIKTQKSTTFVIEPLSKWGNTTENGEYADNVKAIIAAAEKLIDSDYTVSVGKGADLDGATPEAQVAGAFELMKTDIATVKALLSDKTVGNTKSNHMKIVDQARNYVYGLGDALKLLGELELKVAKTTEMAEQLAAAEKLVGKTSKTEDEGTGTYTFNTYGKLKDDMKTAESMLSAANKQYLLQSKVDAMVATLKADIAALTPMAEIDKTGLEASIKAAEALKEADYTAATWAAVKAALAEAKEVLAKANPTQAELTNAAEKLNKAVEALVKTDKAKAQEKLDAAVEKAEALNAADYTAESMKAVTDAVAKAEALADTATAAEIEAAAKAIEDAIAKLEKAPSTPVQPEIPAAPASGTGWVHASDGTWYYYKDKALQTSKWIYGKGGLWYYVDADGAMLTGFHKIGNAWFMLQTGTEGGTQGKLVTSKNGWINDPAIPGDAYARTDRNSGHFGEITWTAAYGDFVNGHFTKGDPAA